MDGKYIKAGPLGYTGVVITTHDSVGKVDTPITSFSVYRKREGESHYTCIARNVPSGTEFRDYNALPDVYYSYDIRPEG